MNDIQKAFQLGQLILAHALIVSIFTELLRTLVIPSGQKAGKILIVYSLLIGAVWGTLVLGVVALDYFPPYIPGIAGGAIIGLVIGAAASGGKDYIMSLIWKFAEASAQKRLEYGGDVGTAAAAAASAAAQVAVNSAAQNIPPSVNVSISPSAAPEHPPSASPFGPSAALDDADDFIPTREQPRGFLGAYSAPSENPAPQFLFDIPEDGQRPEAFNRTGVPFDS